MWFSRFKWIFYHFVSSLLAIIACVLLSSLLFPNLICMPDSPATVLGITVIAVGVSALSAVFGGFYSSKDFRGALEEITLGAKNIAYGNLDYRLGFKGNAEFDGIIQAFNEMASRLESQVGALQKLAQENEQLLQETKITAVSEERRRLARDLHDAVSQQLFAISMMSATVLKLAEKNPEHSLDLVREISRSATRAQAEMRALLLQLRPLTLQNESLSEALSSLAAELQSKQSLAFDLDLDEVSLPSNIENQLFRIAQEGLSNVLRHAEASRARISLKVSGANHRVILVIEDDGKGFAMEAIPQSSMGIRSIRERSTLIGGTAQWLSMPGKGTKLEIRVPISSEMESKEDE
ncbi:MAG: sensor histidine kinase [Bacillota bacterium]|jgi:NarL family two-component system sensor histidine kinase LiaS|nr:sensor histidine kinase [Bacillota bacterium]NLJ03871.1 sensor histidine kinase [Bacillota bacterium]